MKMNLSKNSRFAALAVLIGVVAPNASYAGWFGDHPRYLHAISDMKYARSLVQRPDAPNVQADEGVAVRELDAAIHEITQAAREDWKPVDDHPPVDANLDRPGRFREALSVLDKTWADLNKEEDNGEARFLRNQALGHLEKSREWIKKAIADKEFDRRL
ncbi:MAG TPA: hypothetical protein V6C97_20345 [Oculatellaceae cyanobacterium]